jgi:hypothetical protein
MFNKLKPRKNMKKKRKIISRYMAQLNHKARKRRRLLPPPPEKLENKRPKSDLINKFS